MEQGPRLAWREAMLVLVGCWTICGLGYALAGALDEPTLPLAMPIIMFLTQWFWNRHRCWGAGVAATITGSITAFALVDKLRPSMDTLDANALALGVGLFVAVSVFTGVCRLRGH
ncbi:hypothetical protein [Streptomyces sp. NPDC057403]|uniref:hypothetical protein n=1 Tax=Streptomyces sp. NPDC057403 TaxID=3346119 RepID=UPI00369C26DE